MKNYNKLVRDRIPEILDGKGVPYEKRIASPAEYQEELVKKLTEEVVEKLRLKKLKERGGFNERIILKGKK